MKSLTPFIIILTTLSCTSHDIMIGKNILIKEFPQEVKLTGERVDITSIGVNDIFVVDTFLICFKADGLDDFFDIYSTNTYQSLGKFLSPGRGPDEFLNAIYMGQYFKDSLNTYMWVKDGALMKLVLFNVTESIRQQKTILDSCIYLSEDCRGECFVLGDTLISIVNSSYNHILNTYDLKKDSLLQSPIIMLSDPFKNVGAYLLNMGNCLRPDHKKFASMMLYFNQINIFSPQFTDVITLSIYKPTVPIKEVSLIEERDRTWYFSDIAATNLYIYALYINHPSPYIHEFEKGVEILQFDWEGTPIRKFIITDNIINFILDIPKKCIYGFKMNEEIYKYDISDYL